MKISLLSPVMCCLLYFGSASAQKRNIYLFKNSGRQVEVRDSADYMRIVTEPDSGSTLYNVVEYYVNNKPKLVGKSTKFAFLSLEGQCATYYPSGKKHEVADYKNGIRDGDSYEYYPNGKLYTHKHYMPGNANPGS